jgi:hypothetical protein
MVAATYTTRDYLRLVSRLLDPGECWEWAGSRNKDGYGKFSVRDAFAQPHRVAYEMFIGPIPDGLEIDHTCNNPPCCNPHHLKATTRLENWERSGNFTAANARKTHCKNGHVFDEANTRVRVGRNGRQQRICRACDRDKAARHRLRKKDGVS